MNNGVTESCFKKRRKDGAFVQSIARIAVTQICNSLGLQGFQLSALDALSDIVCRYIQDLGKLSAFYAGLAGRTESNVFDIVHGLEDLGISHGFVGGSDLDRCFSESGIVKEILRFVGESEEVAFAYSVPRFPVVKERESVQSFCNAAEMPVVDYVPSWLPCFPDLKTFTSSALDSIEESEKKNEEVDEDQKVDVSLLLRSEQRLACNRFNVPFVVKPGHNSGKEQMNNLFLASALEYGEMEVSLVSLPARFVEEDVSRNHSLWAKHVSSLWTFAPVIPGFRSCDLETYEGSKEIAVQDRPAVQLKFNTRKKSLATAYKHRKTENAVSLSWFAIDDSGNDVKMINEKMEEDSFGNGKQTC